MGEGIQAPAQDFRDQEGGDGVLPDGRELSQKELCADIPQDKADGVDQDEGGDGDFHREVLPVADDNGHRHREGRQEHAVRDAQQGAQHGDGYVRQREAVNDPVAGLEVHIRKVIHFFHSSANIVRSAECGMSDASFFNRNFYFCVHFRH